MSDSSYDFRQIESHWQARWEAERSFRSEPYPRGETYFVLVFPPYPNGKIHMGHVRNYTIGDAVARYQRLRGRAVLHPIGFDAFGLPNELEAAKLGLTPEQLTRENIEIMTRQLKRLGYAYDWPSALVTIDPGYYRWNQALFLTLRAQGLAYRKAARVQWCPGCRTSLANEQVLEGRCWRCEERVLTRHLSQWFFRLSAYAEPIWQEAEQGAYPDHIATMVQDWLGKTEGAELVFPLEGRRETIPVFTTKPELAPGSTYLALSPEHPLAETLSVAAGGQARLEGLREQVHASASPGELTEGFDTGCRALHPLTGRSIPVWVAAYVDPEFASGAVMGNPRHDRSDHAFGEHHGLPGRHVAAPPEARAEVIADWEARGVGARRTVFAVRDWLISRQRAWGAPIPVIHCPRCGEVGVGHDALPVRLPDGLCDRGEGNPLATHRDFLECRCPSCQGPAQRETDTMDTFIDTAWYYLRCANPDYSLALCDPEAVSRWGAADLYVGGIEIAVPIMLYGSFIAKALRDAGHIDFSRPCRKLLAHDLVLKDGKKMSKSAGNAVDPETLIDSLGADTVRLCILSLAPPLKKIEWSESRLQGCQRFLRRVWSLGLRQAARTGHTESQAEEADDDLRRATYQIIAAVTRDMDRLQPNTAITALIKFLYHLEEIEAAPEDSHGSRASSATFEEAVRALLVLLSIFTPHLCEELWARLARTPTEGPMAWPEVDREATRRSTIRLVVKIDARTVARLEVPAEVSRDEVLALAYRSEVVRAELSGRTVIREIYVPGQILNLVTRKSA